MTLAIIVAHDPNLVIGRDGELPWDFSEDLKYFKKVTMGHPLLMGRRVFEEINEKPLPGRENIVLSTTRSYDHVPVFSSIEKALNYLENKEYDLVFVIGGGEVYRQTLHLADRLYVTEIYQEFEGDTFFPEYRGEIGETWKEQNRTDFPEFSFVVYHRDD